MKQGTIETLKHILKRLNVLEDWVRECETDVSGVDPDCDEIEIVAAEINGRTLKAARNDINNTIDYITRVILRGE